MKKNAQDTIHKTMTLPAPAERAFAVFAEELDSWRPQEFTWSGEELETIAIEAQEGGPVSNATPLASRSIGGAYWFGSRLTASSSPGRSVPSGNPSRTRRKPARSGSSLRGAERTRVEFDHRKPANHGEGSQEYRAALAAPQGWPHILDRYAATFDRR